MLHRHGLFPCLYKLISIQGGRIKGIVSTGKRGDELAPRIPQLHAKILLNVIVIPIVLPKLISFCFGRSWCNASEMRQICLGVIPVCAPKGSWLSKDAQSTRRRGSPCTRNSSNSSSSSSTPRWGALSSSFGGSVELVGSSGLAAVEDIVA